MFNAISEGFHGILDFIHKVQGPYTYEDPITGYSIFVFLFLIGLEVTLSWKYEPELYKWKDFQASTMMGAGAIFISVFTKSLSYIMYIWVYDIFNPLVNGERINIFGWHAFSMAWYMFLICQVLDDFNYYWHHRLSHTVRCLWAAHIVHHSSDNFNLGTAFRNGWITIIYKPFFWVWLPAIGFNPVMVMICLSIQSIWQFQLHSKFVPYLGFLENFINSHKQHQVHHASNVEYMDKNHGGYLNIFDKLFGTHKVLDEANVDIKFGVVHPPSSYHPIEILTHEYRDIWNDVKSTKNFRHKLMYIFGPPGWRPGDYSQTVKYMQREIEKKKQQMQKVKEAETVGA
ncbi:MAG TPA: sterol desaturase family protein [Cytophagaceae bacterium]|jgi:sterol desaturase/sphingolipid hydroxylase (fatty acid hydroxylase superfamily)|nr:sterol desaturase family protein [Cytophagaceae bacterium]